MIKNIGLVLLCVSCFFGKSQDTVKVKTSLTPIQEAENLYNQGLEFIGKKEHNMAIENFTKAIGLNPTFEKAFYGRGFAKFDSKNYEASIDDYNKALVLKPIYADALFGKAQSFYSLNKKDSCKAYLNKTTLIDNTSSGYCSPVICFTKYVSLNNFR